MTQNEDRRSIVMNQVVPPSAANFSGHAHGGHLMQFLDYVGYVCARRYCGMETVTAAVDLLVFREPVYIGDLVTCYASVNYVGRTSMEIGIRTEAEDVATGKKRHVISSYFTFVAVDEQTKKPVPVPSLSVTTPVQKRRHAAAKLRRELRAEYQKKHDDIKSQKPESGN